MSKTFKTSLIAGFLPCLIDIIAWIFIALRGGCKRNPFNLSMLSTNACVRNVANEVNELNYTAFLFCIPLFVIDVLVPPH